MSDIVPTHIEALPNEIWLKVFDYLDWINLFLAFYDINKRINELFLSIKTLSIYSSCLLTYSNSIYIYFQELPLEKFKQIRHFRLIFDNPYVDILNVAKHFPSFSTMISFAIDANCGEFGCNNELPMIIFHQNSPFLQRLYLDGNVFDQELQIPNNVCLFSFPALLHIRVSRMHVDFAFQILDQCPQLRSFSTKLYGDLIKYRQGSSIILPGRINMGLPTMTKLSLRKDDEFGNGYGIAFIERLLICCPNLHTFILDVKCNDEWETLLEVDWWERIFSSNIRLDRISLRLLYSTRSIAHTWFQKYKRFQSSMVFARLNANIRYDFHSEFMRCLTYDLYITN